MARSITEIQEAIRDKVSTSVPVKLSSSKTSEWSLWTYVVAVAIHAFELVLDLFRKEMETLTSEATPGTLRWYAEMCRRFQYGDELVYNPDTGMLSYPETDEAKRIIAAVAVSEAATEDGAMAIFVKVAKEEGGKLVELDEAEKRALVGRAGRGGKTRLGQLSGCHTLRRMPGGDHQQQRRQHLLRPDRLS